MDGNTVSIRTLHLDIPYSQSSVMKTCLLMNMLLSNDALKISFNLPFKHNIKAKLQAISSDTHQLQLIKLHHFKLDRFKSIQRVPGN